MRYLFLIITIVFSCAKYELLPPVRHSNIPSKAIWSGGVDGGAWVKCSKSDEIYLYYCIVFYDYGGGIWSKGKYYLKKLHINRRTNDLEYLTPSNYIDIKKFQYYDGINIRISSKLTLLPHGVVIHPFDKLHGKNVLYEMGVEMSEVQY